jgi:peroxiredoxin (alkyl hydroperoxide reductase subunit C)
MTASSVLVTISARPVLRRRNMLMVGERLPAFALKAAVSVEPGRETATVTSTIFAGQWLVLFFWPIDFTAVCPTEILEFARLEPAFRDRGAALLGVSGDSAWTHVAWRQRDPDLRRVPFPMAGDPDSGLARAMGIFDERIGVPVRASFVVDPESTIRWAIAHDVRCGRSVHEVLRVLDALLTGKATPCEWRPGEATLLA